MTRRILWHKWNDPVAHLIYNKTGQEPRSFDDDEPELQAIHDSGYGPNDVKWQDEDSPGLGPCVIALDGSVIPINESNLPSKLYNFWVGHTNFDMGREGIADRLAEVDGVESLECSSRYRFRVSFGKLFDQDEVKAAMLAAVQTSPAKQSATNGLDSVKRLLSSKHKFWAIYRMANGKVEVAGGNSIDDVKKLGVAYETEAKEIVTSWQQ